MRLRVTRRSAISSGAVGKILPKIPAIPVNVIAPSLVGTPEVGSVLTFSRGSWTGYPAPSYAFQLRRDGIDIAGTSPYTVLESDYNAALSLFVTATNTEGSASATSVGVTILGNVPVNTVAPVVSGSNGLGDVLTTTTGSYDAYPTSLTYAYQWTRNGVDIVGATASTYTVAVGDSSAFLVCEVTPTNAAGTGEAQASNSITVQTFTAPVIAGVPTSTGTAEVGQILTASPSGASGNPAAVRTWQWLRDGVAISGATAITYTLVTADGLTDVSVRQVETNALGFDQADSVAVAVPDSAPLPEFSTVALGIAGVADGESFTVPQPGGWHFEYQRAGTDAAFIQPMAISAPSVDLMANLAAAKATAPIPDYEYAMAALNAYGGRLVPNSGSKSVLGNPVLNAFGAYGLMLDSDGVYTHTRVVHDPSVIDPLGNTEAVTLTFTAATQHQTLIVRTNNPGFASTNLDVSLYVKKVGATAGSVQLGPSSDWTGVDSWRSNFTAPDDWDEHSVFISGYTPSNVANIAIRPAVGATLPFSIAVYGAQIRDPEAGAKIPLADLRAARLAGHAYAPLALQNAATADIDGGFVQSEQTMNMLAELVLDAPITQYAMSAWIRSDVLTSALTAYGVGFANIQNPIENIHSFGRIGMDGSEGEVYRHGRLRFETNSGLWTSEFFPPIGNSGFTHVHINYGHSGSDMTIGPGEMAVEVLFNGVPMIERAAPSVSAFLPKLLTIGAYSEVDRKATHRVEGLDVELIRFEPNHRISRSDVLTRVKRDLDSLPNLNVPLDAMIMFEGDSTEQFRGGPSWATSYFYEKPGRLFTNHARPGSWYQGGIASNSDYIGTGQRRSMRREALAAALELGYSKVFTVWRPGENDQAGSGVWAFAADKAAGLQTLTDFILDDLEAVDPTRSRSVSVFSTMKQSYWSQFDGFANVEAIWAAVDAIYTEQVDPVNAPYLYRAPSGYVGRKHDYVIKLHLWAPDDGTTTFTDWTACALDAGGTTHDTIAIAQSEAIAGGGTRWHSAPGWVRITGNASGSQYYRRRETEPASPEKFSVNHKGTTTLWYEQILGTEAPSNGIISSDGQHFVAPWSPYIAQAVYGPSIERILELEGVDGA